MSFRRQQKHGIQTHELHASELVAQEAVRKILARLGYEGPLLGVGAEIRLYGDTTRSDGTKVRGIRYEIKFGQMIFPGSLESSLGYGGFPVEKFQVDFFLKSNLCPELGCCFWVPLQSYWLARGSLEGELKGTVAFESSPNSPYRYGDFDVVRLKIENPLGGLEDLA